MSRMAANQKGEGGAGMKWFVRRGNALVAVSPSPAIVRRLEALCGLPPLDDDDILAEQLREEQAHQDVLED